MRIGRGRALKEHQKWFEEKPWDPNHNLQSYYHVFTTPIQYGPYYTGYYTSTWVYPGTISLKGRLYNFTLHGPSFLSKQIKGLKVTDFTLCRLKDILVWYQIECFDFKTWRSNILEFSAYRYFGENREYHVTQVKLLAAINRMNQDLGCIKDPHLPFMVHNPKAVFLLILRKFSSQ